jgi:phosphoglycolate phosphatase-like HAD superfamily hydrolase
LQFAAAEGDHDETADRLLIELAAVYLAKEAEYAERTVALPGVVEALAALHDLGAIQTVVTGNIEPVARMKVAAARLAGHLTLDVGGYGSDHRVRSELVHTASRRIAASFEPVAPHRTWVVGDTPRDLECARAAGVRCVLVATGTNRYEALAALDADAVLADLTDVSRLLDVIASG